MADIANLERQHQDHLDLISQITMYKTEQQVRDNASTISLLLSQLAGKIKVHTISEDKFLYPALLNHTNPKVKATAHTFNTEMGGLAKTFENFKSNFTTASKVSNNSGDFLIESQKVFGELTKRIVKENAQLYPLVSEE